MNIEDLLAQHREHLDYLLAYGNVEQCVLDNLPASHKGTHARIATGIPRENMDAAIAFLVEILGENSQD